LGPGECLDLLLQFSDPVLQFCHMFFLAVSGSLSGGSIANHASQFTFLLGHARMGVERIEGEIVEVVGLVNFRRLGVEQAMERFAFDEGISVIGVR